MEGMETGKSPKRFPLWIFVLLGVIAVGIGILWLVGREARETENIAYENNSPLLDLYNELDLNEDENKKLADLLLKIDTNLPSRNTISLTQKIVTEYEKDDPLQKEAFKETLATELQNITKNTGINDIPFYKLSDLDVIVAPTAQDYETYKTDIEALLKSVYYDGLTLELKYFEDGLGSDKSTDIKKEASLKLLRAEGAYKALAEGLAGMRVPVSKASRHIELANAYLILAEGCGLFADSLADPVLAVVGLKTYMYGYNVLLSN